MHNGNVGWYVYMVRCSDDTLYAGIAKDLAKRILAHNAGRDGAKYTRTRRPVQLVYQEIFPDRSAATKREYQLKKMDRAAKQQLIEKQNAGPACDRHVI